MKDPNGAITVREAYGDYTEWCNDREEEALSKKSFSIRMEQMGYRRVEIGKNRERGYAGLRRPQPGKLS
ncbi:MAG: hypothetical protein ACP5UD_03730 [Conexivisphaera sp.]